MISKYTTTLYYFNALLLINDCYYIIEHFVIIFNSLKDLSDFLHGAHNRFTQPVLEDDYDGLLQTIYYLKEVRDRQYEIDDMFVPVQVRDFLTIPRIHIVIIFKIYLHQNTYVLIKQNEPSVLKTY